VRQANAESSAFAFFSVFCNRLARHENQQDPLSRSSRSIRFCFNGRRWAPTSIWLRRPAGNVVIDTGIAGPGSGRPPETSGCRKPRGPTKYIILDPLGHGRSHPAGSICGKNPVQQIIAQRNYVETGELRQPASRVFFVPRNAGGVQNRPPWPGRPVGRKLRRKKSTLTHSVR